MTVRLTSTSESSRARTNWRPHEPAGAGEGAHLSPRVHSEAFEALRAAWYAKLQRANHTDIEAADGTLAYDTGVRRWRAGMRDDLTLAMGGAEAIRAVFPWLSNGERAILSRILRGESHRQIVRACG